MCHVVHKKNECDWSLHNNFDLSSTISNLWLQSDVEHNYTSKTFELFSPHPEQKINTTFPSSLPFSLLMRVIVCFPLVSVFMWYHKLLWFSVLITLFQDQINVMSKGSARPGWSLQTPVDISLCQKCYNDRKKNNKLQSQSVLTHVLLPKEDNNKSKMIGNNCLKCQQVIACQNKQTSKGF